MELTAPDIEALLTSALSEDSTDTDLTTLTLIAAETHCHASILVEQPGVLAGLPAAAAVFQRLDPAVQISFDHDDGFALNDTRAQVAHLQGPARAILSGERTALNLLSRLSGIATLTRRYVEAVADTGATILDTRKTTPGLRALEKYAVRCGGASNHRYGLRDGVLIKDNHLRLSNGISNAVRAFADSGYRALVQVEAESLAQVEEALAAGVQRILLDNMTVADVAKAVALVDKRALLEASGGITLETVRDYAETGVDFISIGQLTQAAPSLRVSLDIQ